MINGGSSSIPATAHEPSQPLPGGIITFRYASFMIR